MFVGVTVKGLEDLAIKELKKAKKLFPGRLLFDSKEKDFQSLLVVYTYVSHFEFKDEEDLLEKLFATKISVEEPFKVECKREGEHDFSSQDIGFKFGAYLAEKLTPDLKNPKTTVYVDISDNNCIVGLNQINLAKRPYRVKTSSQSLNSCIAFMLSVFADVKKSHTIVDPFCRSSEILIEAARYTKSKKIFGIDNIFNNIRNSKVNAKLAKVELTLHKLDLDWLETKFEANSVDRILTYPLIYTKLKKDILDSYKLFFDQALIILKKSGKIAILTTTPEPILTYSKDFKLEKRLDFKHGDYSYSLMLFVKNK